jgi:hypothetical protein
MSAGTRTMNLREARALHKWPCDGVVRFEVDRQPVPYSLAYDLIFASSGCKLAGPRRIFTRLGVRRIRDLNDRYCRIILATKPELIRTDEMESERAAPDPVPAG